MNQRSEIREFERFFKAYYTPALHYCTTMVNDKEVAEDIVQRLFVSIWEKRNEIEIHTSARAYLYKTVYNASLDHIKHEKVRQKHRQQSHRIIEQSIYTDTVLEKELSRQIEDAIARLPEQCGKIFRLSRFEHLKYREIAQELNISEKTVESQMSKALKLLKEILKDYLFLWIIINHW